MITGCGASMVKFAPVMSVARPAAISARIAVPSEASVSVESHSKKIPAFEPPGRVYPQLFSTYSP
jgi:hypothetical protein